MVSSPGCSRIVPVGQNALWFPFPQSTVLLAVYNPSICLRTEQSVEPAPGTIVWMTCIYYLSWDEIAFCDTSRQVFWGMQMGNMGQTFVHLVDQRGQTP